MSKSLLHTFVVSFLLIVFLSGTMIAQTKKEDKQKSNLAFDKYFYLQGDGGLSLFYGDLYQFRIAADPRYLKFNMNAGLGYQFSPLFGVFGRIGYGEYAGQNRDFNAFISKGDQIFGNANLSFNLSNAIWGFNPDRSFSIVPHIGFGQTNFRARAKNLFSGAQVYEIGFSSNTPEKGWLGNRALAFTVPIGTDVNYKLTDKTDLYANLTYKLVDSDRVDAFNEKDFGLPKSNLAFDRLGHISLGLRYKFITESLKSKADNVGQVTLETIPNPLEERGDSVEVTIKGTFPPKYFRKNAVMNFTPVLTFDGGSVALKPINFKGEEVSGNGELISWEKGGSFTYKDKVPYNPKMNVSELVVVPLIYSANTIVNTTREQVMQNEKYVAAPQIKLADGVIHTSKRIDDNSNLLSTLVAKDRFEKVSVLSTSATIYYQVNLHNLNWNLPLNRKQENRKALLDLTQPLIKGDKVQSISITGWASPEGEETFNNNLSANRARTARGYIEGEIRKLLRNRNHGMAFRSLNDLKFESSANGPDWNGFMAAVEASNLRDKNAILNVIRSAAPQQREQEIRNMILIYPELETEILQQLRRSTITVNTISPGKPDTELSQLSITNPEKLNLEELLYAATLTNDLGTKKKIYANAMRLHPNCARAVSNAAEVEIQMGNYAEAKRLLEKAVLLSDKLAAAYNNLGLINIKERRFDEAEKNLNKAKDLGADVDYHLGVVQIYKGNYAKAINLMRDNKCDYNLGLAQLLNKDYASAKSTLDCAPATAAAFYLKAIIGARTKDNAYLFSNLMKAVEMNSSYKNIAKNDQEFRNYFNEAGFQAIIK